MIVRYVAECVSCESRIITRTQIGHKDRQEHSFPCSTCGVSISYAIDLDQENGKWKYRDPKNAKWVDSEDGAVKVLTFSDEIAVPVDIPDIVSPHIATWFRYQDHDTYRHDETLRQMFATRVIMLGPLVCCPVPTGRPTPLPERRMLHATLTTTPVAFMTQPQCRGRALSHG